MSIYPVGSYVEILRASKWNAAVVVDADDPDEEILVTYLENNQEEWVCYSSAEVRKLDQLPPTVKSKPKDKETSPLCVEYDIKTSDPIETVVKTEIDIIKSLKIEHTIVESVSLQSKYKVGDGVVAAWSKSKNYAARVEAVLPNKEYRVQFEDGLKKIVSEDQMTKEADIIPDPTLPKYTTRHKSVDYNALQNVPDQPTIHKKKKKKRDKLKIKFNFPMKPKGVPSNEVKNEIVTQAEIHHAPDAVTNSHVGQDNATFDVAQPFLINRKDGTMQFSIPIVDPKLPTGWYKHKAFFNNRWQAILINSENRKFFGRKGLLKYFEMNKLDYSPDLFDFSYMDIPPKKTKNVDIASCEKKIAAFSHSVSPISIAPSIPKFSDFNVSTSGNYVCPNNDCKKEFRKENLLMMHLKHYHPEFKKMLPSDLNVADFAYARTNSMDDKEDLSKPIKKNSCTFDGYQNSFIGTTVKLSPPAVTPLPKVYSEHLPVSGTDVKVNEPNLSSRNDLKLKEPEKAEQADESMEIDFESQIALFEITKKSDDTKSIKKENTTPEKKEILRSMSSPPVTFEKMKKEEVVNCICGMTEEDGLMIQCDICLCWQHSHCSDIETENEVPDKYVCKICRNPPLLRKTQKYAYDHDWLHKGLLPTLDPTNKHYDEDFLKIQNILQNAHNITGSLCKLSDAMHNSSIKIQIAQEPNHSKLYLWSQCVKSEDEKDSKEIEQGLKIPVPEVPIGSQECRLNLVSQVEQDYDMMEQRLNELENLIINAESDCSSLMGDPINDKATIHMLIKDLETLRTLAIVN